MTEYDDPRDDDLQDDFENREIIELARSKTKIPGLLLVIFGAITFGLAAWNVLGLRDLDKKLNDAQAENNQKVDADPKLSDEQKKEAKELVARVVNVMRDIIPPLVFVNLAAGGLLILGGGCLMNLKAGWLVAISCIVGIIPFTTACCTGLPFGIWGLVALNSSVVRAGYRAKAME